MQKKIFFPQNFSCDRAIICIFCRDLYLTFLFSRLLKKYLVKGRWRLRQVFFKQNYCHQPRPQGFSLKKIACVQPPLPSKISERSSFPILGDEVLFSPLSHRVRRLLFSPVLLRKFTNTIVNLSNRTGEERRRRTLCDSVTIILFQTIFRQTSLSFKQIFL